MFRRIMKALIVFALFAAAILYALSASAATSGTCGSETSWVLSDDGVLTISGTGSVTSRGWPTTDVHSVIIEDGVTSLRDYAFYQNSNLESVSISNTVTHLGSYCFSGCSSLQSVTIPSGVTSFGSYLFNDCGALTSVTIEGDISQIAPGMFMNCENLSGFTIPASVTQIGYNAFNGCKKLDSITIPSGVTKIDSRAFQYCTSLTSIVIPRYVTDIGGMSTGDTRLVFYGCDQLKTLRVDNRNTKYSSNGNVLYNKEKTALLFVPAALEGTVDIPYGVETIYTAFGNCTKITGVTIPESVSTITYCSFYNCSGLQSISIPEGVTVIEDEVFYHCTQLTSVQLPSTLQAINESAFEGCTALTTINLPTGLTTIEESAFAGCTALTTINLPAGLTTIEKSAFDGCTALDNVTLPVGLTLIDESTFRNCESLQQISFPATVTEIGDDAFSGCSSLQTIYVPDTVTTLSTTAFSNCSSVTSIRLPAGIDHMIDLEGFSSLTSVTIPETATWIPMRCFYGCSSLTEIHIPESVTFIGSEAFAGLSQLQSLDIPAGVTSIGSGAFKNCTGLTGQITLPAGLTKIEDKIYSGCSGLTGSITIPAGVTSIGQYAFDGCSRLDGSLTIPESVTYIGQYAFNGCSGLTGNLTIPAEVTYIGESAFCNCSGISGTVTIPSGESYLRDRVFCGCSSLTGIVIPNSIKDIGGSAFYNCSGLTGTITIPYGVTELDTNTFAGCSSIERVILPDSLTNISWSVFEGCDSLTEINLPGNLTRIGLDAFRGCESLEEIILPDSITSIGWSAFENCSSLESIVIPYGVAEVESSTFKNCTSLAYIELSEGVETIDEYVFEGCGNLARIKLPASLESIDYNAFDGCVSLRTLEYGGTMAQAERISISSYGNDILDAIPWTCSDGTRNADTNPIALNTPTTVTISNGGDLIQFAYTAEEDGTYQFFSEGSMDTYGYAYNRDKQQIAYNDDGGTGYNCCVTCELEAGETYYFGVRFYSSSDTGEFTVTLKKLESFTITGTAENEYTIFKNRGIANTYTTIVEAGFYAEGIDPGAAMSVTCGNSLVNQDMIETTYGGIYYFDGMTCNAYISVFISDEELAEWPNGDIILPFTVEHRGFTEEVSMTVHVVNAPSAAPTGFTGVEESYVLNPGDNLTLNPGLLPAGWCAPYEEKVSVYFDSLNSWTDTGADGACTELYDSNSNQVRIRYAQGTGNQWTITAFQPGYYTMSVYAYVNHTNLGWYSGGIPFVVLNEDGSAPAVECPEYNIAVRNGSTTWSTPTNPEQNVIQFYYTAYQNRINMYVSSDINSWEGYKLVNMHGLPSPTATLTIWDDEGQAAYTATTIPGSAYAYDFDNSRYIYGGLQLELDNLPAGEHYGTLVYEWYGKITVINIYITRIDNPTGSPTGLGGLQDAYSLTVSDTLTLNPTVLPEEWTAPEPCNWYMSIWRTDNGQSEIYAEIYADEDPAYYTNGDGIAYLSAEADEAHQNQSLSISIQALRSGHYKGYIEMNLRDYVEYRYVDLYVFNEDGTYSGTGVSETEARESADLIIPNSTTVIESEAFAGIRSGLKVFIPAGVTTIAGDAFDQGGKLTIYGVPGTRAQDYAADKGFAFIPVTD